MKNLLIKALLTVLLCAFTQASFAKDWSLYDSYVKLHYQDGKVVTEGGVYAVSICHKISHQDCHDLSSKIAQAYCPKIYTTI